MKWGAFFMALAGPMAKQVLISLGIGFISFVGLDAAVTAGLSAAKGYLSGMPSAVISILAIAGVWTAMSIVVGGILARLSMMVLSRLGKIA